MLLKGERSRGPRRSFRNSVEKEEWKRRGLKDIHAAQREPEPAVVGRKRTKAKEGGIWGWEGRERLKKRERATWVLGYHASASAPVLLDRSSIRYVIRGSIVVFI